MPNVACHFLSLVKNAPFYLQQFEGEGNRQQLSSYEVFAYEVMETMPKNRYSEEEAVQKPASELLRRMGWDVHYCFDDEVLGPYGTLGRDSYRDVLLKRDLMHALVELNEHLTEEECAEAVATLEQVFVGDSLLQTNEAKYKMLRDGIPVKKAQPDGSTRTELAQVFDFEHPRMNSFVAAEELWVKGPMHRRRCDIVGFVNGVPLLFVEFKRHDKDVLRAYEDNYTDYQDTIPQIFYYNAFVMLSNGLESKIGTLGSSYEFFGEWKRLSEGDAGSVVLETMLRGVCNKETLLDLFQNFILFDHFDSPAAKILARNHQYLGVNEAVRAYSERELRDGKLGVFWHTQGSGKSYSMVFLAEKIRRTQPGSPTFLVLTDRDELNKQISETFESCGCLAGVPPSAAAPRAARTWWRSSRAIQAISFRSSRSSTSLTPSPSCPTTMSSCSPTRRIGPTTVSLPRTW